MVENPATPIELPIDVLKAESHRLCMRLRNAMRTSPWMQDNIVAYMADNHPLFKRLHEQLGKTPAVKDFIVSEFFTETPPDTERRIIIPTEQDSYYIRWMSHGESDSALVIKYPTDDVYQLDSRRSSSVIMRTGDKPEVSVRAVGKTPESGTSGTITNADQMISELEAVLAQTQTQRGP